MKFRHYLKLLCCFPWLFEAAYTCCAVSSGGPVVNSDQEVILLWDQAKKTQHFIRKATFASSSGNVGFLVPSPTRPTLEESGNAAFDTLRAWTSPPQPRSLSKASSEGLFSYGNVEVVEQKTVAGFDLAVLAADNGQSLVEWLKKNGYAHSPQLAAWSQPYLDQRWYMTAMKISTAKPAAESIGKIKANSVRISFQTDTPLFPYREPDSAAAAKSLKASDRQLVIYFIAEAAYTASFPNQKRWSGKPVFSQALTNGQRAQLLKELKLSIKTGPDTFWLTKFVDDWKYSKAPGDVYFAKAP
jgi:hypothetical protein